MTARQYLRIQVRMKERFAKKRRPKKSSYRSLEVRKRYLIVCEGTKSEPNYFEGLAKELPRDVAIIARGKGMSTLSLVDEAIREQEMMSKDNRAPDEVWVVMDNDDFPAAHFDNAIQKCESHSFKTPDKVKKTFKCGWSNEAFELWYVLHFDNLTDPRGRKDLFNRLKSLLGKYEKSEEQIYQLLKEGGGDENKAI